MEPSTLGWEPLLKSWIETAPEAINPWLRTFIFESLFLRYCKPLLYLIRRGGLKVNNK